MGTDERVAAILAEREAVGLRAPAYARLLLMMLIVPLLYRTAEDQLTSQRWVWLLTVGVWMGLNIVIVVLLHQRRHVQLVGALGALLDGAFVASQFVMALIVIDQFGLSPSAPFKSQLPLFGLALAAINGLALRPRYPLIVGFTTLSAMAIVLAVVWNDPAFVMTEDIKLALDGGAVARHDVVNEFLMLAMGTVVIALIARAARTTIRKSIAQELEAAEVVMREKMEALGKLVAGVSHELNSPLGVVKSGLDTQTTAIEKLQARASERDAKLLGKVREISSAMRGAIERIDETSASLRNFARLDEADLQKVDVRDVVISVLDRMPSPDGVRVERDLGDAVHILANARELNQALATVVENAFEAITDEGVVHVGIDTAGDEVRIAVRDDGRGMADDVIAGLFDVMLRSGDARVAASFGLAAAQSVAQRHGGHLDVESEVGSGSTLTFRLPISRSQARP